MSQLPSSESKQQPSSPEPCIQQNNSSNIDGGQQAAQGNNNIQTQGNNSQIQSIILNLDDKNELLEKRVNELQKNFRDFQERYEDVLKTFDKFRRVALANLENLPPENIDTRLALAELLEKTFQLQTKIENAKKELWACQKASEWLSSKRKELIIDVRKLIIKKSIASQTNENSVLKEEVILPGEIDQFCKDIDNYLFWIGNEMAMGRKPSGLPGGTIPSSLPIATYIEIFKFIKDYKILAEFDLPEKSAKQLKSYINRFIIKPLSDAKSGIKVN